MIRNLICHVYPLRDAASPAREELPWRRTVAQLQSRRDLFNGRRIIAIATDERTDSYHAVREAFAGLDAEFLRFKNNPLQEASTFLPSMDLIAGTRPDEITFRCHAKGATHLDLNSASHMWADAMYATCLDCPGTIDVALESAAICGPFRSIGLWPFPDMHAWHFAGSFYWFRHDRTFNRDWRRLIPTLWAVEAWPGIFPLSESACLFYDNANSADLYNNEYWRENITPILKLWRQSIEATGVHS